MKTVYKYLVHSAVVLIDLPRGAKFLRAGVQGENPVVWYEVDTALPEGRKTLEAVPTGSEVPRGGIYLDTVQIGQFVWHIYEVPTL